MFHRDARDKAKPGALFLWRSGFSFLTLDDYTPTFQVAQRGAGLLPFASLTNEARVFVYERVTGCHFNTTGIRSVRRGFVLPRLTQLGLLHGHQHANIRDNNRVEMRPALFDTRKPLENLCISASKTIGMSRVQVPPLAPNFKVENKRPYTRLVQVAFGIRCTLVAQFAEHSSLTARICLRIVHILNVDVHRQAHSAVPQNPLDRVGVAGITRVSRQSARIVAADRIAYFLCSSV